MQWYTWALSVVILSPVSLREDSPTPGGFCDLALCLITRVSIINHHRVLSKLITIYIKTEKTQKSSYSMSFESRLSPTLAYCSHLSFILCPLYPPVLFQDETSGNKRCNGHVYRAEFFIVEIWWSNELWTSGHDRKQSREWHCSWAGRPRLIHRTLKKKEAPKS